LSTNDGKKYTAVLVRNSASGRFVYEICACCGDVVYWGDRHPTAQLHGRLKDILWEKWHPKLKNQNLGGGVLCAQSTEKRKLQCTAAKCVT